MYVSAEVVHHVIDRSFILMQGPVQRFILLCTGL